jgi:hypothetical protein
MEAQSAKEHDDEATKKDVFARVSSQGGDSRFEREKWLGSFEQICPDG